MFQKLQLTVSNPTPNLRPIMLQLEFHLLPMSILIIAKYYCALASIAYSYIFNEWKVNPRVFDLHVILLHVQKAINITGAWTSHTVQINQKTWFQWRN